MSGLSSMNLELFRFVKSRSFSLNSVTKSAQSMGHAQAMPAYTNRRSRYIYSLQSSTLHTPLDLINKKSINQKRLIIFAGQIQLSDIIQSVPVIMLHEARYTNNLLMIQSMSMVHFILNFRQSLADDLRSIIFHRIFHR